MKKSLVILLVALVALALLASCKNSPDTTKKGYTGKEYAPGSTGPGGGIVFYDVDADNDSGNADGLKSDDCGWRYLEAAAKDAPSNNPTATFVFGYYIDSSGTNQVVGTTPETGGDKIGAGKDNTSAIIAAMGNGCCSSENDSSPTRDFSAAGIIISINTNKLDGFGGKDDWFLPSKEEALAMVNYITTLTNTYWTSTEAANNSTTMAITVVKNSGETSASSSNVHKNTEAYVRPVRRF